MRKRGWTVRDRWEDVRAPQADPAEFDLIDIDLRRAAVDGGVLRVSIVRPGGCLGNQRLGRHLDASLTGQVGDGGRCLQVHADYDRVRVRLGLNGCRRSNWRVRQWRRREVAQAPPCSLDGLS